MLNERFRTKNNTLKRSVVDVSRKTLKGIIDVGIKHGELLGYDE